MSLINEALKQAENEHLSRPTSDTSLPQLKPVRNGASRLASLSFWGKVLIGATFVVAAVAFVSVFFKAKRSQPQYAVALVPPARPTAPNRPAGTSQRQPTDVRVSEETERAYAKTVESVLYYKPPVRSARKNPSLPSRLLALATMFGPNPGKIGRTPTKTASKTPKTPAQKHKTPSTRPKTQPALQPVVDTSRFSISGIMYGDGNSTTIINGYFLKTGDSVEGAKIIKINPQSVELEISGQRVTIRM